MQARSASAGRLRLPLLETSAIMPALQQAERRLRGARGWRNDSLQEILTRNEFGRLIDGQALQRSEPGSPLAAKVLASRAVAHNLLGDFAAGRADAEQALAIKPADAEALDSLAVAQLGEGRAEEALNTFGQINPGARSAAVATWLGSIHYHLGRPAQAEPLLREAVDGGSGEGRSFAMIWLFLAAEAQGGRGKAALEPHLDGLDATRFPTAILRYLAGRIDRDALLKVAAEKPEMERLNLAEAHFFIGQRLMLDGKREDAAKAFQRAIDTQATPYREVTFARLELARLGR
jgi:lipoprotein NlpI